MTPQPPSRRSSAVTTDPALPSPAAVATTTARGVEGDYHPTSCHRRQGGDDEGGRGGGGVGEWSLGADIAFKHLNSLLTWKLRNLQI